VISDHAAYGIVPRSPAQDEAELPQSFGETPPQRTQLSPPTPVQKHEEVQIEKRGSSYYVPVRINDTITLPFLLDTGAGDLAIAEDVARTLIRAGALKSGDLIGKRSYQIANGSEEVSPLVSIREVRVGEHMVRNVTAGITQPNGELLLGQSFLSKFGAVTVDYKRLVLVLSP
jgi:clan AA aspartic protease (TIGR02281 family)